MELLKNILIKEVNGQKSGDLVAYIDNIPKSLLYRRARKMVIDHDDPQNRQNLVPDYEMVNGRRTLTNAMVDELLPGIERSQTGDEAYVFFIHYNEAKARLGDIDRYCRSNVPVAERLQERVPYSIQPGVTSAGTIPLQNIPHVVLPGLVSPPEAKASVQVEAHMEALPAKKVRKPLTDAQKNAARERLARGRAIALAKRAAGEIKA